MNNKFLLMLLAGTVLSVNVARAQEQTVAASEIQDIARPRLMRFDRNHHKAMAAQMAADLDLTKEQVAQAEQIRMRGHDKIAPLMDEMMSLRKKIDDERRANMEEFEKILTPEQQERFNQIKLKHEKFRQGPRHPNDPKLMRGIHKIYAEDEAVDERVLPEQPQKMKHKDKDRIYDKKYEHKMKKHHKNKHKEKGGFVDDIDREPAKGGFVGEETVKKTGGFIDETNVYLDGGNVGQND